MVLLDKAMTELSSLTASVTLDTYQYLTFLDGVARGGAYINELGFFFFFKIAVAVSSSSLASAPEASLRPQLAWELGQ